MEAAEQLTRALGQIAALAITPTLRQHEIQLQVALITPLIHLKGHAAPETKAAAERARLLIERAEALGEAPQDQLLLFSALYGFWIASYVKFDGDMMLSNAREFLAMAEKQRATVPIMVGHRLMGISLFCTGDIQQGQAHFDRASASYDPAKHRALGTRFGVDTGVSIFAYRSQALWVLGHSEAALAGARRSRCATALASVRQMEPQSVSSKQRGDRCLPRRVDPAPSCRYLLRPGAGAPLRRGGSRTKNGRAHTVPLSPLVRELIACVKAKPDSPFIFTTTGTTPVSGWSRMKDRLDAAMRMT